MELKKINHDEADKKSCEIQPGGEDILIGFLQRSNGNGVGNQQLD
jgi:hypothetical protein